MARISGVTIPVEKQVQISLTYVYGIGPKHAKDILVKAITIYCPKFGGRTPHLQCVVSTYNIERCKIIKKQATQYTTAHTI